MEKIDVTIFLYKSVLYTRIFLLATSKNSILLEIKEKRYCYGPISCTAVADFGKPMDFDLEKVTFSEMFLVQDLIKQVQKYGNLTQICYNKYSAFNNLKKFIGFF